MKKFEYHLAFILYYIFVIPTAQAQNEYPIHQIDGDYISEWLLLGPFFPYDLEKDFLKDVGGEANILPRESDTVITERGDSLTWNRYSTNQSIVNLLIGIGCYQNATAYAFSYLKSDTEGSKQILLGSDDGASIWINGSRVHSINVGRPLFLDNDKFESKIKKGKNACLVKISQGTLNWGFSMRVMPHDLPIFSVPKFYLTSDHIKNELLASFISWKYHSGDDSDWSDKDFDDSLWELKNPLLRPNELETNNWPGVGWFRLHIAVDSFLINEPIGLSIRQAGSSQIYLDGNLIYTFGENSNDWTGVPKVMTFEDSDSHVLAVRYSNYSVEKFSSVGLNSGFSIRLGNMNEMAKDSFGKEKTFVAYQMFFTGLTLAIGLLHLILFIFFPSLRQNFFFAIFLFSYSFIIFYDYQHTLASDLNQYLFFIRMHRAANALFYLLQLGFLYSLFL